MKLKPEKFLSCLFICVIILFACSVCYKVAAKGIEKTSANEPIINIIDWAKLYPFESDSDSESVENTQFTQGGFSLQNRQL